MSLHFSQNRLRESIFYQKVNGNLSGMVRYTKVAIVKGHGKKYYQQSSYARRMCIVIVSYKESPKS